jgi:succinate dehydrogenase/fumarate reductase flavoprotein subunit
MKRNKDLSRRDFIKTTTVGVGATAMTGLASSDVKAKGKSQKWDYEADVVVVGYGGAGVVAAITAHDAGAKVLVLEKAPFRGGGSTSMSFGQCASPSNAKDAADYLYAGCGGLDPSGSVTPRKVIEAWAEEVCKNKEWFDKMGIEHKVMTRSRTEFMNLPGASSMLLLNTTGMGQALFQKLDKHLKDRGIEVLFDSPAVELIQDQDTKQILGVRAKIKGEDKKIKAKRGVVLCTGGFEFNEEMKRDFMKCYPMKFYSWKYNTGDGVRMCQKIGADLWHMDMLAGGNCAWFPDDPINAGYTVSARSNNFIWVNKFGKRFCNEPYWVREHHKGWTIFSEFSFDGPGYSRIPAYLVFDETARKTGSVWETFKATGRETLPAELGGTTAWSKDNLAEIEKGWIKRGETIEALAAAIGSPMDATNMKASVESYNSYCAAGKDPEFDRSAQSLKPLETPPYYAVPLYPGLVCTHGGARKNGKAQILDTDQKPIPRLYSAGSFGSVYGRIYSVTGGNVGELCAFGRIAGRNAAAEKPWG